MEEYLAGGGCGNLMIEKWVNGKLLDSDSKAMAIGAYFEFILTGALPKSGIKPVPQYYAEFKKKVVKAVQGKLLDDKGVKLPVPIPTPNDMLADYKLAHANAERVKGYLEVLGLKIIKAGVKLTKGRFEGTIDIIAECTTNVSFKDGTRWRKGDQIVIDLKYAGTIDDKWNPFGWVWTDEQKRVHGKQAKHYHMITGLPFYFLVCSSTNESDIKLFKINFEEGSIENHIVEANRLEESFRVHEELGFVPRPEISKCLQCPLVKVCKDAAKYPEVETININ